MKLIGIAGGLLAGVVCAVLADDMFNVTDDAAQYLSSQAQQAGLQPDQSRSGGERDLQGQWVSNCYTLEPGTYQLRTFEFVLNQLVTITTLTYPDRYCQQKPTNYTEVSATWDLGVQLTSEEGLKVHTLDVLMTVGKDKQLVAVKQIVRFQRDYLMLGISHNMNEYPQQLDWEIRYSKIH